MKAHTASLINAVLLIVLPLWGYLSSETPSKTALIPAGIGIILLVMNPGVKEENKVIAHIAVLLTLLILIALIKPLMGAVGRGDSLAILRLAVMIISTALAMVFFVKSFIDARKRREKEAAEEERRRDLKRKGRRSTILTGTGLNEIEDENIKKRTLLGG